MNKFLRFVPMVLCCTLVFSISSCSDDDDESNSTTNPGTEDVVNPSTVVNPLTVFNQGIPSQVGDYTIVKNADGLVSKIIDRKEKETITFNYTGSTRANVTIPTDYDMVIVNKSDDPEDDNEVLTFYIKLNKQGYIEYAYEVDSEDGEKDDIDEWWFKYNDKGQLIEMKRTEGGNEVTTITYDTAGDIIKVSVSDDVYSNKTNCSIAYTNTINTTPITNKSGIMLYDESLSIDMDEMSPAYFAGLLGKGTTNLPLSAVKTNNKYGESTTYTFSWTLNTANMPVKFISKSQYDTDEIEFKW